VLTLGLIRCCGARAPATHRCVSVSHQASGPLSTLALCGGSGELDSLQSLTGRELPAIGWGGRCHSER
jgi:hypothetical protein